MTTTMQHEPTVTRARVEWATVPRVNLLPAEILEGRTFRRTQLLLAAAVAVVAMIGLLCTFWAQHQVGQAEAELAVVAQRTSDLQRQQAEYAEVPRVMAKVDAAVTARERAMATDVLWYRFLDELAVATPDTVWLGALTMTMNQGGTAAQPRDALTPSGLGEITVTGTATRYPDVADWLTKVITVHGMDLSRLQSASLKEGQTAKDKITFGSSVNVTSDALSHRYDRKAG